MNIESTSVSCSAAFPAAQVIELHITAALMLEVQTVLNQSHALFFVFSLNYLGL